MSDAPLLDVVRSFLDADGWAHIDVEGETMVEFRFTGASTQWACLAQTREAERQFVFYSVLPDLVQSDRHDAVAELTARINFGLVIGNFEFDVDNGELRYKTSVDVGDGELTPALVRQVIHANLVVTDRYIPALVAVGTAGVDPVAAIDLVDREPAD